MACPSAIAALQARRLPVQAFTMEMRMTSKLDVLRDQQSRQKHPDRHQVGSPADLQAQAAPRKGGGGSGRAPRGAG